MKISKMRLDSFQMVAGTADRPVIRTRNKTLLRMVGVAFHPCGPSVCTVAPNYQKLHFPSGLG